jgi:hypothetical protein
MNSIPKKLRAELAADPYYRKCCLTGKTAAETKIEWHHGFIWAGKQLQEKWAILPVTEEVHKKANNSLIKGHLDLIMLCRASDETLTKYSKAVDLLAKRERLKKRYKFLYENYINQKWGQNIG